MTSVSIFRGQHVQFNCDTEGLLTGHVLDIQRDLTNGQKYAIVEIDHELPGIVHAVPLEKVCGKAA